MSDQKQATTVDPSDPRQTMQLCADLISGLLRRTDPQDPDLLNAHAACTRWLDSNSLPKLVKQIPPHEHAPNSAATLPAPQAGARWSHVPVELLRRILRLRRAAGPKRTTAARDMSACSLVCRTWEPTVSDVLWESVVVTSESQFIDLVQASASSSARLGRGRERAGGIRFLQFESLVHWRVPRETCWRFWKKLRGLRGLKLTWPSKGVEGKADRLVERVLRPLLGDLLPGLNVNSPLLTALDVPTLNNWAVETIQDPAELTEVAGTISRLAFLRMPYLDTSNPHEILYAALGPALRFWAPDSCLGDAAEITATSLPHLECIEFPAPDGEIFDDQPGPSVSTAFMHKLASLQPPLRQVILRGSLLESEAILTTLLTACPTIQEIDLAGCEPISDKTLAALENHPPLYSLDLSYLSDLPTTCIASLLRARGSKLRFLGLPMSSVPALFASYAPSLEHIALSNPGSDFPGGTMQLAKDIVGSCPRLKRFTKQELKTDPDFDRVRAFFYGLRVQCPLFESSRLLMPDALQVAGEVL
ncbi:hypothetical protein BDK51DRAFT_52877 [Blyttiomyces helicus]|uniref:F-box domain-containing protein n=1 Tax=Blyttiomyces helicus TaxID=388810 RepID=A0A4P9WE20_9FUNG|nr:hypothetical protein BDK51DRAFT_52877 [Blyttiomyces helicus]|eukprot:RKO88616.1 hypothetical protein BDK51DRAFT_52877 [Blyttiomyces helicus]